MIGRWSAAEEWAERTRFAAPTARRVDSMAQAATLERYQYAKRNDLVERVIICVESKACTAGQHGPKRLIGHGWPELRAA